MWTIENRARYKRDHLRYPSDVTDEEWAHVELLIPPAKRGGRNMYAGGGSPPNGRRHSNSFPRSIATATSAGPL
jgi:hypothetical protein